MRKIKGIKAQSRIETSDFKLGRPVPSLIGHGFFRLSFYRVASEFTFSFL